MTLQNLIDHPGICTSNFIIYRSPDGEYYPLSKDIVVDPGYKQICIYNGLDLAKADFLQVCDLMQYLETEEYKNFDLVMGTAISSNRARSPLQIQEVHSDRVILTYKIHLMTRN